MTLKLVEGKTGIYHGNKKAKYIAVVFAVGTDGKRKRLTKSCNTIAEAEKWRIQIKANDEPITPDRITVSHVAKIAIQIREDEGASSIKDMKRYVNEDLTGIIPFFGAKTPLKHVSEIAIARWYKALKIRPKRRNHKGTLSPQSIVHRMNMLQAMLNLAFKRGWITRLPAFPKIKGTVNRRRELPIDLDDFVAITNELEKTRAAMCWMILYTGQRIGDVVKMKKSQIRDGRIWYIATKTDKDGLTIPLTDHLKAILDAIPENDSEYLFPKPGTNEPFKTFQRALTTACKRAGRARMTTYHPKHLAASFHLIWSCGDVDMVCRIFGITRKVLERHYGHLLDRGDVAIHKLEEAVGG